LFYTPNALYIGAKMFETNPGDISNRVLRQGQALSADDIFAVILDPYLDRRNGYRFEVNPNGVRWEGLFQNINEIEGNWDGIWESRARTTDFGWEAEIRIPFQSLSFNPTAQAWGLNFNRIRRRSNESIAWSSYNREINPSTSGTVNGLVSLQQGRGLDIVPSMALVDRKDFAVKEQTRGDVEPQLDVFYKLTPQLNASLTLNTDFSSTEVDDRQVNLTRFNLFFPEKRDFFLRDVDIFEFGQIGAGGFNMTSGTGSSAASNPARQSARPFFSRRIGLSSTGGPVGINGGVKLSGRIDDWNVGALMINQEAYNGVDAQTIFVGRTVLNVGSRTQLGAIVTDGNPQSNASNQLVGVDFRYRNTSFFGNTIESLGFYEETKTEGKPQTENAAYSAAFLLPNSQGWQGLYFYKVVEKNFFPAVGYVNATDIEDHHFNLGYRQFMKPDAFLRSVLYVFDGYKANNLSDGSINNANWGLRISSFTNHNDALFGRVWRNRENLKRDFTIFRASDGSRSVVIPEGEYEWDEATVAMILGGQRKISGSFYLQGGGYYGGTHMQQRGNVTWRPNSHFSIDYSLTHDKIKLPQGYFILRLMGLNLQYVFSSTLSWSNLVQYDNISENLGFNSRLHWIPKAGQQAFLVLNWGFIDADKDNNFDSTLADLSLKFNYTLRF
jgi:hypothetical protein